jgi:ubiquinone/menaquinone biosynthesis C-methylase UbiE
MDWAERIDTMTGGYRNACILIAALKTGIFEALGEGSKTSAETAAVAGLDPRATDVAMCALAAAEILLKDGEQFSLDPGARPYLLADSPETMVSIIGHNRSLLKSWVQLEEVLKTGAPAPREERTTEEMEDFICGMENVSRKTSWEVVEKIDLSQSRNLLDLGGGPGTAALAFAQANPELHAVIFDLEGPVGIAKQQIEKAGLSGRVTTCAGDFHTDDLPGGFDTVYISNIIHMLSPAQTRDLLEKAARALVPGGLLLVKDFFLEDSRVTPAWTAQFSVNMLVGTEGGKSYTLTEMTKMLADKGFGGFETTSIARSSLVICAKRES